MVLSDCEKVQHLISTKRNYYMGVHSSKKALKIYCPSIYRTKYPAESSSPHSECDPQRIFISIFFFFFWQSLISLGDAAELYNFGQRQMCDDSVTWQWGQGSGGFKNECGCMLWVTKTSLWVQRGVADDSM